MSLTVAFTPTAASVVRLLHKIISILPSFEKKQGRNALLFYPMQRCLLIFCQLGMNQIHDKLRCLVRLHILAHGLVAHGNLYRTALDGLRADNNAHRNAQQIGV